MSSEERTVRQLSMDQAYDMVSGLSLKFSVGRAFPEQQRHRKCLPPFCHEAMKMMGISGGQVGRRRKETCLKPVVTLEGTAKREAGKLVCD